MAGRCITNGKIFKYLNGHPVRKRSLTKTETGWDDLNWINLAQDRDSS